MKKIILTGLTAGISMLVVGMCFGFILDRVLPTLMEEYQNPNLFRSWSDPLMSLYFLHPFILGVALSYVWEKIKGVFSGGTIQRGLQFGVVFWIIAGIPGMLISYSSFPVSLLMILSWTISGLMQDLVAGLVLVKMNK